MADVSVAVDVPNKSWPRTRLCDHIKKQNSAITELLKSHEKKDAEIARLKGSVANWRAKFARLGKTYGGPTPDSATGVR